MFSFSYVYRRLNSTVNVIAFNEPFTPRNAFKIVEEFDLVLDCTDNAATRYLLNDACVLRQKCLISGRYGDNTKIRKLHDT